MEFIIHRIRLNEGIEPERFETWVREVDYAACTGLPSVLTFSVQRVSGEAAAPEAEVPVHYFEIIGVSGRKAFEDDMRTGAFHELEAEFGKMAQVIDELAGERVGPGYRSPE